MAAVDDVTRSSAVCASKFGREDGCPGGGGKGELVGEPGSGLSRGVEVSVTSSRSSVFEAAYLGLITSLSPAF